MVRACMTWYWYHRQFHSNTSQKAGTPSSRPGIERLGLPPSIARVLQAPQTPRRTPQSISKININTVESVDLTGDDAEDDDDDDDVLRQISSPSSAEMFGSSQVI